MKHKIIFIIPLVIALLAVFTISPFAMWQSSPDEYIVPNSGFVVPEFIVNDEDYIDTFYKPQSIQTFTPALSEAIYDAFESDVASNNYVDTTDTSISVPNTSNTNYINEYIGYSYSPGYTPQVTYRLFVDRHDNSGQYGTFYINFNQVTLSELATWYIVFRSGTLDDSTSVVLNIKGYNVRENGASNIDQVTISQGVVTSDYVDLFYHIDNSIGVSSDAYDISLTVEFDYTNMIDFEVHYGVYESTNENGDNIYKSDVEPFSARMINITEVSYADFNLLSWLGTALDGFANTPLFVLGQAPDTFTVTVGGLLAVTLALPLFIAFLKKFAGG